MKTDWLQAYHVEAQLAEILAEQEQYGWLLDVEKVHRIVEQLIDDELKLTKHIEHNFKKVLTNEGSYAKTFNKDGSLNHHVSNWCDVNGLSDYWGSNYDTSISSVIAGTFTKISLEPINLSSPTQLKEALFELGWIPDEWNYKKDKQKQKLRDENGEYIKSSPKITESSLESLEGDDGLGADLAKLLKIQARIKFFAGKDGDKGILSRVRPDNTIASEVMQCATNTGRATHIGVANVPRVGSFLGEETRSCFIARPNRLLIGTDYSQLESRIIAHAIYLYTKHKYGKGDTRFADIIADVDDLHTYLWDDLRDLVSSRSLVKNINYAFPYGAQASKLGSLCDIKPQGMSNKQAGERILEVMQDKFPGLVETRDATMEQAKCGYVPGLDGRKIYIRSPHSAFNAKAQGWGAEVVKMGIILANQYYREESLDARQVGWYHDETQVEASAAHAEATAAATERAFHDSGTFYNLSCPMDAQAKIGTNWAETH